MRNKKQLLLSVLWTTSLMLNVFLLYIFTHDILTPYDDIAGDRRQKLIAVQKSGYKDARKISDFLSWDAGYKAHLDYCQKQRQQENEEVMKRARAVKQ